MDLLPVTGRVYSPRKCYQRGVSSYKPVIKGLWSAEKGCKQDKFEIESNKVWYIK